MHKVFKNKAHGCCTSLIISLFIKECNCYITNKIMGLIYQHFIELTVIHRYFQSSTTYFKCVSSAWLVTFSVFNFFVLIVFGILCTAEAMCSIVDSGKSHYRIRRVSAELKTFSYRHVVILPLLVR